MSIGIGPFEMVLFIVIAALGAGLIRDWMKERRRQPDDAAREALLAELEQLRRRVEALEAIVTDGREDLRRRFSDLERSRF